ncbi:MAG: hypothetical protein RIA69_21255 [Cyclobacteriaceae bacterium]
MTKEDWQNLYNILDQIHSDFQNAYHDYKNGRNKAIRSQGERKVDSSINLADYHISKNYEAYELLTGIEGSDYSRAINYDEFKQPRYFGRDLSEFLEKIKVKIKSPD